MPQPTKRDLFISRPLTSVSLALIQSMDNFVARKVFPVIRTSKCQGSYYEYARKQWMRSDARKRAPGTESVGSGWDVSLGGTYDCQVRAIHKDIDDQIRSCADDNFQLDKEATMFVTRHLLLGQELDWAEQFFKLGVWGNEANVIANNPADAWDLASSDPITQMDDACNIVLADSGMEPNTLVVSNDVFKKLKNNAAIIDRIKFSERALITEDILASVLGIDKLIVAKGIYDTTQEGGPVTPEYICTNGALLMYVPPAAGLMTASAGYTFVWSGYIGANAEGLAMAKFRMQELRADRIEGEMAYDQKLVSAPCGFFFGNVIS